jgi:hypothetical protein
MLSKMNINVNIAPIVKQVNCINFEKSLAINYTDGSLLNGPYKTKPEYVDTPLGELLDLLGNPGEARLLKLESGESYTAHSDPDDRIHVAITTNDHAYLINFDDKTMYHLPVDGECWLMDTSKTHIAGNFGARPRIHLNIRVALPKFTSPGYSLKVEGGDYAWKQDSYMILMSFFNTAIKHKIITGFKKVTEREVLINCNLESLNPYINELNAKGFNVGITDVL